MGTAEERDAIRGNVARTFAEAREAIEKQYISDKNDLEEEYQRNLKANDEEMRRTYLSAGLNPDGSDPQGRPQSSTI